MCMHMGGGGGGGEDCVNYATDDVYICKCVDVLKSWEFPLHMHICGGQLEHLG